MESLLRKESFWIKDTENGYIYKIDIDEGIQEFWCVADQNGKMVSGDVTGKVTLHFITKSSRET